MFRLCPKVLVGSDSTAVEGLGPVGLVQKGNAYFLALSTPDSGMYEFDGEDITGPAVLRLNPCGELVWAAQATGMTLAGSSAAALAADRCFNSYLTGLHNADITFGSDTLTGQGAYVTRVNKDGEFVWAIPVTSTAPASLVVFGIAESQGEVFISGSFATDLTIDGTTITATSSNDSFMASLSKEDGSLNWLQQADGGGFDFSVDISSNKRCTFSVGGFDETITFGDTSLVSKSPELFVGPVAFSTTYVAKTGCSGGNWVWARAIQRDTVEDITYGTTHDSDQCSNTYIGSFYAGKIIFNNKLCLNGPDYDTVTVGTNPIVSSKTAFVSKMDRKGCYKWLNNIVFCGDESPFLHSNDTNAIEFRSFYTTVDAAGNVHATAVARSLNGRLVICRRAPCEDKCIVYSNSFKKTGTVLLYISFDPEGHVDSVRVMDVSDNAVNIYPTATDCSVSFTGKMEAPGVTFGNKSVETDTNDFFFLRTCKKVCC